MFIDAYRDRRRSRPGMRAFQGASMGGPERYTREEMSILIEHAEEFAQQLGDVLRKYVPKDAPDGSQSSTAASESEDR